VCRVPLCDHPPTRLIGMRPTLAGSDSARPPRATRCTPHPGFDDLFAFVVRPNPVSAPREVYEIKSSRWQGCWPRLIVLPWQDLVDGGVTKGSGAVR
jgi:hypothetical protein